MAETKVLHDYLSEDDKKSIDKTLKAEKAGKLKSMKQIFG